MSDFGIIKYIKKTRKPHGCVYCGRTVPIGHPIRNFVGVWQGDWQNHYTCGFCEENVEPDYSEPGEEITGDEFRSWFMDTEDSKCVECGCGVCYDFIDATHMEIECDECGCKRTIEIPIDCNKAGAP